MQCKCKPRHSHKDTVKGFKPAACQRITQEQKFKQNSETHHPTDTRASDCRVSKVHTLVLHTLVAVIQSSCSFQSSVHSAIKVDGWNLCTAYFKRILNTPFILDIYTFKFWRELRPDCCCLVFVTWGADRRLLILFPFAAIFFYPLCKCTAQLHISYCIQ